MKFINKYLLGLILLLPQTAWSASFDTIFGGSCTTYECWFDGVWAWALGIAIPVSIVALMIAGVIYSTSGGNPDRIGMAKKIMIGVLSGIGLLILSGVFKATFLGVPDNTNQTPSPSTSIINSTPSSPSGTGGGMSGGGGDGGGGGGGGAN